MSVRTGSCYFCSRRRRAATHERTTPLAIGPVCGSENTGAWESWRVWCVYSLTPALFTSAVGLPDLASPQRQVNGGSVT